MAADLYLRDLDELLSQLSMSQCNAAVRELCGHSSHEPYRSILRGVRDRLNATRDWAETNNPPNDQIFLKKRSYLRHWILVIGLYTNVVWELSQTDC